MNFKNKNIVILSHTYLGSRFVVGSHHIAKELSSRGNKVIHISTPISIFHFIDIFNIDVRNRLKLVYFSIFGAKERVDLFNLVPISIFPWKISGMFYSMFHKNLLVSFTLPSIREKVNDYFDNRTIDLLIIDHPLFIGIEHIIRAIQ